MRLFGLINWYAEPAAAMTQATEDCIRLGCTRILALDGPYLHYPGEGPSSPDAYDAVRTVCQRRNVPVEIEYADDLTEAGKRTRLFDMAYEHGATSQDWMLVNDGDHRIAKCRDLKPLLEDTPGDVFDTYVVEGDSKRHIDPETGRGRTRWVRNVFRAVPGLHVHPESHWTYMDGSGRVLWGYNAIPADGDLPIVIYNRSEDRSIQRRKDRDRYYKTRADERVERMDTHPEVCECGQPVQLPPINADLHVGQNPDDTFSWSFRRTLFLCPTCREAQQEQNTKQLKQGLFRLERDYPAVFPVVYESVKHRMMEIV